MMPSVVKRFVGPSVGVFLLAVINGCGHSEPPKPRPEIVKRADPPLAKAPKPRDDPPAPGAREKEEDVRGDESLDVQEYVRQGMPPLAKPWTAAELAEGAKVVLSLAQSNPH